MVTFRVAGLVLVSILLVHTGAQETVEQRIETVFGGSNSINNQSQRAGFDVIVQPDPIVEVRSL